MAHTHNTTCRICASPEVELFLSLGDQPPVDNFVTAELRGAEARYPLDVYMCKSCGLVQLLDVVPSDELFHNEYAYFSAASAPLVRHFESYAADIKANYVLPGDLVVDIGSNDGSLLQFFLPDYRVLGVEPALNTALVARKNGIETLTEFFTQSVAENIVASHGKAKVVTANNVFAHIDDIKEVVRGVKALLADDGVFVFEAHYLVDLIEKTEFDTVYHEHLCYYSVKPLQLLFQQFGMVVTDVQRVKQHGGSIRVFVRNVPAEVKESVARLMELERSRGLHSIEAFRGFQARVEEIRTVLVREVRNARAAGKRVVGYGAPAKGNTLLNFCEFTATDIDYITDTTPQKIGLYTPGSHIRVVSPDILKQDTPDYVLLLAWNYRDFILKKELELRERGAKFIIPIPNVQIV